MPSLGNQGRAEAREIPHLGIVPDCAREPFHDLLVLLGPQRQNPHQVKRFCMAAIKRERLFATELRIEIAPRLHMAQAGLMECIDGIGARGVADQGRRVIHPRIAVHKSISSFQVNRRSDGAAPRIAYPNPLDFPICNVALERCSR